MSFLFSESSRPRSEPMSFFQGIKLVMGYGPYAKLVMAFLFTSLGFMVRTWKNHTHSVYFTVNEFVYRITFHVCVFQSLTSACLVSRMFVLPARVFLAPCACVCVFVCSSNTLSDLSVSSCSSWRETLPCSAAPHWVSGTTSRIFCWSSWWVETQRRWPGGGLLWQTHRHRQLGALFP